ncbi:acetyl-CoA carboxylase biotin carboxyl carrier protein, partial [Streptomyces cavourensis]
MDLRKLKTLIDLVAESGIAELEITEGEGKVRIVKFSQTLQPVAYHQPEAACP